MGTWFQIKRKALCPALPVLYWCSSQVRPPRMPHQQPAQLGVQLRAMKQSMNFSGIPCARAARLLASPQDTATAQMESNRGQELGTARWTGSCDRENGKSPLCHSCCEFFMAQLSRIWSWVWVKPKLVKLQAPELSPAMPKVDGGIQNKCF